jgi:hypothetical protein
VAVIEAFYPGMEGLRRQLIAAECWRLVWWFSPYHPSHPAIKLDYNILFTRINIILL